MSEYQEKLKKYGKIINLLLYIVGVSPTAPSKVRMIVVIFSSLYMIWISTYNIYVEWPNWQEVTANMTTFLASLLSIKIINYSVRRKHFFVFLKTIEEDFCLVNKDSPDSEKEIILQHANLAYILHRIHAPIMFSASSMWILIPVFEMFLLYQEEHFTRVLPFKTWVPFQMDAYSDPMYGIQYSLQTFNLYYGIAGLTAMDCLFYYLILHTCAQFRLLQERIRNFNKDINGVDVDLETQEINIKKCIKQHQNLLDFCSNLEDNLTEMLLVQLFVNCTFLCMAVLINAFPISTFTYIQSALAVLASLSQSFLHCYLASRLTTEGLNVATAAYDSEWYKTSISIKKCILFLIMRGQKPINLRAGKMIPMSVETFEMITRTAVSYSTVFSSMKDDN